MEKKKNTDFNESDMFMVSRAFAAMSVVAAHLSFRESYVGAFLERIGTIGVVAFFIMSGFFFRPNKFVGYKDLLKKKLESIIIPWIILGSAMWGVYAVLREKYLFVLCAYGNAMLIVFL